MQHRQTNCAETGTDPLHDDNDIDDASTWDYATLFWSFWPPGEYCDGPTIAAAGLEDPRKLRFLLDRADLLDDEDRLRCSADQVHDFKSLTPLLRAIERQRPESVQLLLDYGANSDGVKLGRQKDLARRFRRFCYDDSEVMHDIEVGIPPESVGSVDSQTMPSYLTDDELDCRRSTLAPFWAAPHCLEMEYSTD